VSQGRCRRQVSGGLGTAGRHQGRGAPKLLERNEIESEIERLSRLLGELRPQCRAEARLSSLVVTDRIDRYGRYHHIDPWCEAVLGFPPERVARDVGWIRFNHPDDVWRTTILWEKALAGQTIPIFEYRTDNSLGQWVWLEDSLRPLQFDRAGQALLVEGRWRDVTPRKRRELEFLIRQWESILRGHTRSLTGPGATVIPFLPPSIHHSR
jgi:PAS domain-containing protein